MTQSVVIMGATGLVGAQVVTLMSARADIKLHIVARRTPVGAPSGSTVHVADPATWSAVIATIQPDLLINCLGTTIRQAGSPAAFVAVDHDLVVAVATAARASGTQRMIAMTSVGASARSNNLYLKTKGRVEDALRAMAFDRLDIVRPGLLRGIRGGDLRLGERIAMLASPLTDALLHGPLRRYRSIDSADVAKAILALSDSTTPGYCAHEHDAIMALRA